MQSMEMGFASSGSLMMNTGGSGSSQSQQHNNNIHYPSNNNINNNHNGQGNGSNGTMIEVVAPCDMDAGYTFMAKSSGNDSFSFRVTVPEGGVRQGQTFWTTHPDNTTTASETTPFFFNNSYQNSGGATTGTNPNFHKDHNGHWKDGLFDCFRYGVCHPSLWNALFCPQILMAQVLTRMHLTWLGDPEGPPKIDPNNNNSNNIHINNHLRTTTSYHGTISNWWQRQTTFSRVFIILCIYWTLTTILSPPTLLFRKEDVIMVPNPGNTAAAAAKPLIVRHHASTFHSFLYNLVSWAMGLYTLIVLSKLRRAIRHRYGIALSPTFANYYTNHNNEFVAEDCCVSMWCGCCSVAQMARQTCDYEQEAASCCTPTGLFGGGGGGGGPNNNNYHYYYHTQQQQRHVEEGWNGNNNNHDNQQQRRPQHDFLPHPEERVVLTV